MGYYISIGFVYSATDMRKFNSNLKNIAIHLSSVCNQFQLIWPKDNLYEEWEEKTLKGIEGWEEAFIILDKHKMSYAKMPCKIHDNQCDILVSIRGEGNLFKGFLFEIPGEGLLPEDYTSADLDDITNKIVGQLKELWKDMEYSYAFCDCDADIEYQLSEIEQNEKTLYSVLLLVDNRKQLIIRWGSWCIDGLTPRE